MKDCRLVKRSWCYGCLNFDPILTVVQKLKCESAIRKYRKKYSEYDLGIFDNIVNYLFHKILNLMTLNGKGL